MSIAKKISIVLFLSVASCYFDRLKPMESATLLPNAFDVSGPSQLLDSIKTFQKNFQPEAISEALRICLKNSDKNLCYMTCYFPVSNEQISHTNILYFLDETCNRDTVAIILSAIDTEADACEFILSCENGPSGLERMLRKNYQECALPMIELLWKNKVKINVHKPGFFIGINIATIDINAMATKARKKLESPSCMCLGKAIEEEISDEMVLKVVFKELKTQLNKDPLNCEGWLGFFK